MTAGIDATNATLLLSPEDSARMESVEVLARSGRDGVLPLIELLVDSSWAVRRAIVAALAAAGDAAVEDLCDVLLDRRDHEGRLSGAVAALVASPSSKLIGARMIELATADDGKRCALPVLCDVVEVLGRRRVRSAVPMLAVLAKHVDDNVAGRAIEALGWIGGVDTVDALVSAVELRDFFRTFPAIDPLGRTGDGRAIRPLASLLADSLYASEAARSLGHTGQERAVGPLASLLVKKTSIALVRTAAIALAELRERHDARFGDTGEIARAFVRSVGDAGVACECMIESLPGMAPSELAATAGVLGWLGDDLAVRHLVAMITREPPVGPAATAALEHLGSRSMDGADNSNNKSNNHSRSGDNNNNKRKRTSSAKLPATVVESSRHTIDDLLRRLTDVDADVRVRACEALARLGNPAVVSALFRLIGDRDERVAHAVVAAIQSLGSLETKQLALEQARSSNARTRRAALRIISYFGFPEGLDVLTNAMTDEDEKVREAAIYGLPFVDDARATDVLLAAEASSGGAVRAPALDEPRTRARTRAALMRALGHTSATHPSHARVVTVLRASLAEQEPWTRYYACQALGRLHASDSATLIVELLKDPAGQVRVAAVEALAHLHDDASAQQALAQCASTSEDIDMRRAALLGLGIARRSESIPVLQEAATAADSATRLVAIGALSELDDRSVVPILAAAASDPDDAVRSAAISYLSSRPGADATNALVAQLLLAAHPAAASEQRDHDRDRDRGRVVEALATLGDQRISGVVAALASADEEQARLLVTALTRMRRPGSDAAIRACLDSDNVHARCAAAAALAVVGAVESREALIADPIAPDTAQRHVSATGTPNV